VSDGVLAAPAPPAPPPAPSGAGRRPSVARFTQRYGAVVALVGLFAYNAAFTPFFLTTQNLVNIQLRQAAPVAIVALGMALVISTGGIDLSVGSVMAIAGQVGALALLSGFNPYLAWAAALTAALACGLFNGMLVARYAVQPIIATLILFIAGRGIAQLITDGKLQSFRNPGFQWLGLGRPGGIPAQVLVLVVVALVVAAVMRWTTFGRYVVAVGGNETSSRLAGVPVARTKLIAYGTSGLLAGLVGLIVIGNTSASDANNTGLGVELDAIAAVAVAGVPLTGGRMTVVGTVVGALTLRLLQNTLIAHGIPKEVAQMIQGVVIVLALYLQRRGR